MIYIVERHDPNTRESTIVSGNKYFESENDAKDFIIKCELHDKEEDKKSKQATIKMFGKDVFESVILPNEYTVLKLKKYIEVE